MTWSPGMSGGTAACPGGTIPIRIAILVSETDARADDRRGGRPLFRAVPGSVPDGRGPGEADEADVLKAWEGLGYYRRARQLQEAARVILRDHAGVVPDDPEALRALPGVGRYIAGAILSFAFDRPAPIIEANTQRVLARWLAWGDDLKTSASQARLWEAAGRLVPPEAPGQFNQAFMELGATLSRSERPDVPGLPSLTRVPRPRAWSARRLACEVAEGPAVGRGRGMRLGR